MTRPVEVPHSQIQVEDLRSSPCCGFPHVLRHQLTNSDVLYRRFSKATKKGHDFSIVRLSHKCCIYARWCFRGHASNLPAGALPLSFIVPVAGLNCQVPHLSEWVRGRGDRVSTQSIHSVRSAYWTCSVQCGMTKSWTGRLL